MEEYEVYCRVQINDSIIKNKLCNIYCVYQLVYHYCAVFKCSMTGDDLEIICVVILDQVYVVKGDLAHLSSAISPAMCNKCGEIRVDVILEH